MADEIMDLLQEIETGIEISRNIGYTNLASLTVLVLDWALTLSLEISLVWMKKWNAMTIFFLITRYLPFALFPLNTRYVLSYDLTASECRSLYNAIGGMYCAGIVVAQFALTIRTWVIWNRGKLRGYGLFGGYILAGIVLLILTSLHLKRTIHKAGLSAYSISCNADNDKSFVFLAAAFIVLAAFETVMILLLLSRGMSDFHSVGYSHLLETIYSDGLSFYIYLFGLAVVNIVLIFRLRDYMTVLVMLEGVFYSIFSCRVVLHIKQEVRRENAGISLVSEAGTSEK